MTPANLLCVMDETWPAAAALRLGPWLVRDGQGGGKRVSATSVLGKWNADQLGLAETAMLGHGQAPLFLIQQGDEELDVALAARGYGVTDPVVIYAAPCSSLPKPPAPMTTFPHWPPMAVATDLWQMAGIGPPRIAVMHRARGAKTAILARTNDRASGAAFVAMSGDVAMLHALEVAPALRRQGSAHNMLRAASVWAQDQGALTLALAVTAANEVARSLYASFGMTVVGHYHYRQK